MVGRLLAYGGLLTLIGCQKADGRFALTDTAFADAQEKCSLPNAEIMGNVDAGRIFVRDYRQDDAARVKCLSRELDAYRVTIGFISEPPSL